MYLYNTWEETGDESVECRALRKFLRQIELHKTGRVYFNKGQQLAKFAGYFAQFRHILSVLEIKVVHRTWSYQISICPANFTLCSDMMSEHFANRFWSYCPSIKFGQIHVNRSVTNAGNISSGFFAGNGKLCIFGHLGSVFIWSCFVSCLLLLLFYVICAPVHVLTEGTISCSAQVVPSPPTAEVCHLL